MHLSSSYPCSSLTFPENGGWCFCKPNVLAEGIQILIATSPSAFLFFSYSWHCHLRLTAWKTFSWSKMGTVWGMERPGIGAAAQLKSIRSYSRDQKRRSLRPIKKKKEDPIPEPVITLTILENAMAWYKSGKNRLPFICTIELPAPGVYKPFLKRSDG